ncbi:MAG: ribose 5-phosphate isomerase B [Clostridiales bacterium]|nr:ribose 5-phosphate isomerase B [Clostridiales bacterium]
MEKLFSKIYIGADSAGFQLKEQLIAHLTSQGYEVADCGAYNEESSHYPEFAKLVCQSVKDDKSAVGILVCGTGIGMSIAANKHRGIRAAVCGDTFSARMTRLHNNANILCIGARVIGFGLAADIVDLFVSTPFESGGRHALRVGMIDEIEAGEYNCKA